MASVMAPRPSTFGSSSSGSPLLRTAVKSRTMSITQTYYLAHKARAKLSHEAAQPDHDLRLLVGHANLLDSLMLDLAEAEREQERWFNQSVRGAAKPKPSAGRRIQWVDQIMEEAVDDDDEYDSDTSDSDSESDSDEEVEPKFEHKSKPAAVEEDDLEEDYAQLELVRTPSHSNSPPDLIDHDSESSEDEAMPPSPRDQELPMLNHKEHDEDLFEEDYIQQPASLVPAIPVY